MFDARRRGMRMLVINNAHVMYHMEGLWTALGWGFKDLVVLCAGSQLPEPEFLHSESVPPLFARQSTLSVCGVDGVTDIVDEKGRGDEGLASDTETTQHRRSEMGIMK